jgi:antagonist of KipI
VSIIIRKPGILTTVQDLGRTGYRRFGINPNGVMDTVAARIANSLVGNNDDAAVIETHFPACEIEFDTETSFAIAGADLDAELNGIPVRNFSSDNAEPGGLLRFKRMRSGARSYIAVQGGFEIEKWLDSWSTNLTAGAGGFFGRKLNAGDVIPTRSRRQCKSHIAGPSLIPRYSRFPTVRIIAGNEFDFLTAPSERKFLNEGFSITNDSNRMGYRLSGPPLHLLHNREMTSAAVTSGTIQLLPDGQLIVLMADHQTSGGYPRIGNVVSNDLPLLGQCSPGDGVSFALVSIDEAERLAAQFEKELNYLRVGLRLQGQNANG